MPQASVNAIAQTRDGYLWIATYGGLVRFDGRDFTTFRSAPGSLSSNRITDLHADRQGRLWIVTQESGLVLYANGKFNRLDFCGNACLFEHLRLAADGHTLWLQGINGVYELDSDTLEYRQRSNAFDAFAFIEPMPDGYAYVAGREGLQRFDKNGPPTPIPQPGGGQVRITDMAASGDYLWLIDGLGHAYRYDTRNGKWTSIDTGTSSQVTLRDSNTGVAYMSRVDGKATWQLHNDGTRTLLAHMPEGIYARAIYADQEGDLWIGSNTRGLWRLRNGQVGVLASQETGMNLPGRAIAEDGKGGFWFGMTCHLRHLDAYGNLHTLALDSLPRDNCVQSLLVDGHAQAWVGTQNGLLFRLHDKDAAQVGSWPQENSLNIWQDPRDGRYWGNTFHSSFRLDIDAQGRVLGRELLPQLEGMQITQITAAQRGGVWFVGNLGAYRILGQRVVERLDARDELDFRSMRWLHEDADGSLWIGTYGNGLLHVSNGKVRRWDKHNGLFDDSISCVLEDALGRLWLGSNNGIALLPNHNLSERDPLQRVLSISDGLVQPEINGGMISACLRDSRGHLWFSLISGYAMVDPARFGEAELPPPRTHINHLALAGKPLDPVTPGKLGVDASNLEIGYDAVSLAYPERLRFRYRIVPGTDKWVDAGEHRSLLLSSLPWGKFRFEVQARLFDSAWSPSATLELDRPTPWYRWKLVWLLVSLGGVLALLWITRDIPQEDRYRRLLEEVRASIPEPETTGRED